MIDGQLAERGSIIVVIATDAPLAPHQLKRVARRAGLGLARGGTPGGNSSGDIFLAFSIGNHLTLPHRAPAHLTLEIVNDDHFDPIYLSVVECVEEAVLNAMLAATETGGGPHDRCHVPALPIEPMMELMRRHGRVKG